MGTSPFIGAGQFEERAVAYLRAFYGKPESVADVLEEALQSGAQGVQALPHWYIVEAIALLRMRGWRVEVWASLPPRGIEQALEAFRRIDAVGVAVHGLITDSLDKSLVEAQLDKVRDYGFKPGLALHTPRKAAKWVLEAGLEVDFLLAPFNKLGLYMDAEASMLHSLLLRVCRCFIAMKVLAAGRLRPREALEFVLSFKPPPSLALGVASREEARETFSLASKLLEELA